jgi:drug/metabolite transporter (DMT)-like permease
VLITTALLWPIYRGELFTITRWRLQLLRGLMLGSMTAMNFFALQYLQLAETGAIQFSVPLLIAVISSVWLHERLDARRWLAIGCGFVGVLLVIRPGGQGFHPALLLSVINALLYAGFNLLTRELARHDSPAATQLMSAVVSATMLAPFAAARWQPPEGAAVWALVAVCGLCGGLGHYFVAKAHRHASAATLSPFLYQQIVYMTAWGWLLFGQMPDGFVIAGAVVVVASGLYLLWLEVQAAPAAPRSVVETPAD